MKKIPISFTQALLYPIDTCKFTVDTAQELLASGITPVAATVPGNAELDLERAGILPELFYSTNILALRDYELFDYWYRLLFDCNETIGENGELLFEGLDTLADIWLNGEYLGHAENMFIPHAFSVKGALRQKNELWVRIKNPVRYAQNKEYDTGLWGAFYNAESVHLRKAPHSYGWDICPRAMGGGIFGAVFLTKAESTEIENVYLHTLSVDYAGAHIRLSYDLKLDAERYHKTYLEIEGVCENKKFSVRGKVVFKHDNIGFTVPPEAVALWNPVGYGTPNLYNVTARLVSENGEILAQTNFLFGIRTVSLDFDPKGEEKKFLFRVNGVPVLCKGTNWVPLDAYHSRDAERMKRALALLADSGCNIVRCWGGNLYEPETFFDFCDRHGILVWQDFAMACNVYPCDESFRARLEEEVKAVVCRIRSHACLLCYCGDNEGDLGMYFGGIDPTGYKVTRDYLPTLLFRFDPFRPFLPSSPYFCGKALRLRDERELAENHLWGPRNNFKSDFYTQNKNMFISEIGYHGCPSPESIRKFIAPESLWPWENDDWMAHQTSPCGEWTPEWNRIKLMAYQVRELFGHIPENLEEFALCSQISQAEALKFFVESTRLHKWEKTGIIWWNLLDCWPQFSDAVVDYYFCKKLAYYYLANVQKNLCFMIDEPSGWGARAVIGNDGNKSYAGTYEITDGLSGKTLAKGEFTSPANENVTVCELPLSRNIPAYFILRLNADKEMFVNHYAHFGGALQTETYKKFLRNYAKFGCVPASFAE
ncbi:MAG: glycoside hydrolase family 2 [Clostridia bacterium]|nr:glycoside hydrolase family 2 [Clostridia bacterium]